MISSSTFHTGSGAGTEAAYAAPIFFSIEVKMMLITTKLPKEVSVEEAAGILAVGPATVMAYYFAGLLPARNLARPFSPRRKLRLPLDAVLELRTRYEYYQPGDLARRNEDYVSTRAEVEAGPSVQSSAIATMGAIEIARRKVANAQRGSRYSETGHGSILRRFCEDT